MLVIMFAFVLCGPAFSEDAEMDDYERNVNFFEYYDLVDGEKVSASDTITRREALIILCNIYFHSYTEYLSMPYDEVSRIRGLFDYSFSDVDQNSPDGILVGLATKYRILKGTVGQDGAISANLDGKLTLREALTFIERELLMDEYMYDLNAERIESDWFEIAQTAGIINYNTCFYHDSVHYDRSESNEPIPFYKFLQALYNAVHIPTNLSTGYAGAEAASLKDVMRTKEELELSN